MYLNNFILLENHKKKDVKIQWVPTEENLVDPLTKLLS
jgi:hypothetical protein